MDRGGVNSWRRVTLDRLAGRGARLEVENCAHAGKHKGVAPVSLGEFSRGLGEASGLTGIDLDPRQTDLDHRLLEQAMVGPCRLENDSGDIEPSKPFDEGAMAFRIVCDAKALTAGMDRYVESVFRNVDADALRYC
jgi:hypothetical protein